MSVVKKRIALLAMGLALVFLGVTLLPSHSLSYLWHHQTAKLGIRAAPADDMWKLDGDFAVEKWKQDFASGIRVANLTEADDLWLYLEYTGDLAQVFQQAAPVHLTAGSTRELYLIPIDNQDSPRVLNPHDIMSEKGKWKSFQGTVQVHTLNRYATLETDKIVISGKDLWEVLFQKKYGENPLPAEETPEQEGKGPNEAELVVPPDDLKGNELEQAARDTVAQVEDYQQELSEYQPLSLTVQVRRIVDKVAPGLLKEHGFLFNIREKLQNLQSRLTSLIDQLLTERRQMQGKLEQQQQRIDELIRENDQLYQRNQALEEEIRLLQARIESLEGTRNSNERQSPQADRRESGKEDSPSPPSTESNPTPEPTAALHPSDPGTTQKDSTLPAESSTPSPGHGAGEPTSDGQSSPDEAPGPGDTISEGPDTNPSAGPDAAEVQNGTDLTSDLEISETGSQSNAEADTTISEASEVESTADEWGYQNAGTEYKSKNGDICFSGSSRCDPIRPEVSGNICVD